MHRGHSGTLRRSHAWRYANQSGLTMALRFARASRLPPFLALQVSTCRIPQYACFFLHTLCKFYAISGGCRSRAQAFDEGYMSLASRRHAFRYRAAWIGIINMKELQHSLAGINLKKVLRSASSRPCSIDGISITGITALNIEATHIAPHDTSTRPAASIHQ